MGRKNSSESEDDSKDRRDKHRHSSKRDTEANGDRRHSRHGDESELSDSDKKNRSRRHGRRDEKDVRGRDRRQEKEHRERKERVRSSDEDDRRVERERGRRDKVKTHQRERLDSQDEDYREGHKRSEQRRERTGDDEHRGYRNDHDRRYLKDRRGKEEGEHREDRVFQEKEKEEGEVREDNSKSQKQSTLQGSSLNADVSNWGRSGGVYIPPFKLAQMMKEVQDKSSIEYQRLTWDALRKSINGLVNKVNATNIKNIIPELFGFTDVFAALVAVVNTKFPEVGELLMRRIVLQFKRAYKRNDKHQLLAAVKFIAHLVNQQVAHEIIALELLALMLENPTDDSVEVAVGFVKECGSILQDLSPKGLHVYL
ncbi:Pre-mRNA-splicing factor CWC22 [Vitis vinifera]|uniref:Pre-mRNA-splicing factor CWC22 n=1 Tax=Vitis vinifera TaxID=29760 RepID=A0A438DEW0_VITVI|nr:Pre-mRNA-splicing factor CWC22 [Vitis vinifera]